MPEEKGVGLHFVRPPQWLESLAASCLLAEADDSRLGDLAETYVRSHERAQTFIGPGASALAAAPLVAGLGYLAAAANVALFARVVDPALRLAEAGIASFTAFYLQERIMALLNAASRKLMLPALLLAGSAFLVTSAVDTWYTWRHAEQLMADVQREKAQAAATQIEQFLAGVQSQISWVRDSRLFTAPLEQRRFDYVRLLRQVPAISTLVQLDVEGKEVLNVDRLKMDVVDSGVDYSKDMRFTEAMAHQTYVGPVYFRRQAEPYISLALLSSGKKTGVLLAELNLRKMWDAIDAIKVGDTGYAYVVDGTGKLIAYRDSKLMVSQPDLSTLPQVAAALAAPATGEPADGKTFGTGLTGSSVLSATAAVPTLGWWVFVELPAAEAYAPLWAALIRGAILLALGVVAALLASIAATRRVAPGAPAPA
jgi:two-component system, NtrC family, sensor kinase